MSGERLPEFLDTNVLVYAHDSSAGAKHRRALELLADLAAREVGALSVQVLQEFFVTVTRKVPRPLPAATAAGIVADLAVLPTHVPRAADVVAAIDLHERWRVSFWDAMIIRSALSLGCAWIWSEDLAAGQAYDGVTVRNPFA
ncbi:MAG TPA: PIN domain-containing protein [Candidatus Dormibacteraeota bacterium]|nr:PIN domain-containing protein [Candidatus Dormibacteraeota bacterium]